MKDIWLWLSVALLAILFVAIITPTSAERAAWQTKVLPCSKEEAFQATIAYIQDIGYVISEVDPNTGFIATAYSSQTQLRGFSGSIERLLMGERRFAVTVLIQPLSSNACKMRANLIAEEWVEGAFWGAGHWRQDAIYYDKQDYQDFFNGLLRQIQRTPPI